MPILTVGIYRNAVCLEWRRINKYWVERRSLLIGFGLHPSSTQVCTRVVHMIHMQILVHVKSSRAVFVALWPSHQCIFEAGKYVTHCCAAQCRAVSKLALSGQKGKSWDSHFLAKRKKFGLPYTWQGRFCWTTWTQKMHFKNRTRFCTDLVWIAGLITGQYWPLHKCSSGQTSCWSFTFSH